MVANSTNQEESWNHLQKQLTNTRKKQLFNNTYGKIHANKVNALRSNLASNANSSRGARINVQDRPNPNQSFRLSNQNHNNNNNFNGANTNRTNNKKANPNTDKTEGKMMVKQFRSNVPYSPLQTPPRLKALNGGGYDFPKGYNAGSGGGGDLYGNAINPLPSIRSPYQSSRDTYGNFPNLESWGIPNQAGYDDPSSFNFNRYNPSPLLPMYSMTKNKKQKPYIVVPKLRQPVNLDEFGPRFDYISTRPYNKPRLPEKPELLGDEADQAQLRSDEYLRSANQVLRSVQSKNYDGKDLFSTKFLDDLDYRPSEMPVKKRTPPKPAPIAETPYDDMQDYVPQSYRKPAEKFDENRPIKVKKPPPAVKKPQQPQIEQQMPARYSSYAVDVAEEVYDEDIEEAIRKVVESTLREEKQKVNSSLDRLSDEILDSTMKEMMRSIAQDELTYHKKLVNKIQTIEIKKVANEHLMNNMMLDKMLDVVSNQTKEESDEVNKLFDAMTLDVLLNVHNEVRKSKSKTLNNYPIKKFHLNTFMNVALDTLITELSGSLEDDMKDLDMIERKTINF